MKYWENLSKKNAEIWATGCGCRFVFQNSFWFFPSCRSFFHEDLIGIICKDCDSYGNFGKNLYIFSSLLWKYHRNGETFACQCEKYLEEGEWHLSLLQKDEQEHVATFCCILLVLLRKLVGLSARESCRSLLDHGLHNKDCLILIRMHIFIGKQQKFRF